MADDQYTLTFQSSTVSKAPLARYYLRSMEQVGHNPKQAWYVPNEDKESMTLEHVLPEKPEGNWPGFSEEEVDAYARRLGNMCLLPKKTNSDLKSADERTKFAIYKD